MKFDEYILKQCKKAGGICKFLNLECGRSLIKVFIEPQFAYCPLVWMYCASSWNNCINHLHEQALRIIYNDDSSTFEDLLIKSNSISVHHTNIRLLAIELCKAKNNLSSKTMHELFQRQEVNYTIRSKTDFSLRSINSSVYGLKSLRHIPPKIWTPVLQDNQTAFPNLLGRLSRG